MKPEIRPVVGLIAFSFNQKKFHSIKNQNQSGISDFRHAKSCLYRINTFMIVGAYM